MGVITQSLGAAGEYEEVEIPGMPAALGGPAGTVLRRPSPRPSRRAVLHVHSSSGPGVPEDLARWYTERGFHFYVTDLTAPGGRRRLARLRRRAVTAARFGTLDAARRHLTEVDGIDSIVISAQSAEALTVALWCDARRAAEPADAVILSCPAFGRRLRHALRIACPVLVICPAAEGAGQTGRGPAAGDAAAETAGTGPALGGPADPSDRPGRSDPAGSPGRSDPARTAQARPAEAAGRARAGGPRPACDLAVAARRAGQPGAGGRRRTPAAVR